VIYPAFQSKGIDDVPADVGSRESASITPKMPSLFRRVFAAIGRTRDNFRRLSK
jgi:hypothetical protein